MESEGSSLFTIYCGLWCLRNVLHAQRRRRRPFRWEVASPKGSFELQAPPLQPVPEHAEIPIGRTCKLVLDSPRMTLKAMLEITRCPTHIELHLHAVHTNAKQVPVAAAAPIWLPSWVSSSGTHAHHGADTLTAKEAFLELVALLDRLASQCNIFRIVIHSRSLADGLQKHLRAHGYHEVAFGGFGILRLEKICRHPKVDRLVVCLAGESQLHKTQQWYAAVLGLQMRPEPSIRSPSPPASDGSLVLPDLRSTPVHVAWIAADGASAIAAGNPPSPTGGSDVASAAPAKQLSSPLLAIHIETPDLESWKQHLQLTQVRYSEESDAALTAVRDATDVSYTAGLCFRDPAGLRIRVLQPAAATAATTKERI